MPVSTDSKIQLYKMSQFHSKTNHRNSIDFNIPLIDISNIVLHSWDDSVKNDPKVGEEAAKIYNAMATAGFLYVTGHGIPVEEIDEAFQESRYVFEQTRIGGNVLRRTGSELLGFVDGVNEVHDTSRPSDIKMAYDVCPNTPEFQRLPVPLRQALQNVFRICHELSLKLIRALALAMGKDDIEFFVHGHKHVGDAARNSSNMRTLYYPAVEDTTKLLNGQLRTSQHSDFGTITLLFQTASGLEVQGLDGEYFPVEPLPGTIVVNIGDLLQRWSNGELQSTVHRVVAQGRSTDETSLKCRQSIAFFLHPDLEQVIGGLSVQEHIRRRNLDTFQD